jgi:hypothetical protein
LNAAFLSALATLIATVYSHVLTVAMRLWEMTSGFGLMGVIRTAGPRMLLDMARIGANALDVAWALGGIVVAVFVSMRILRRPARTAG